MINKITHLSNILLDIEIFHFNIIKDQQNQNIEKKLYEYKKQTLQLLCLFCFIKYINEEI